MIHQHLLQFVQIKFTELSKLTYNFFKPKKHLSNFNENDKRKLGIYLKIHLFLSTKFRVGNLF